MSLIIHEPIILLDDRNQSRAHIFIAGIEWSFWKARRGFWFRSRGKSGNNTSTI